MRCAASAFSIASATTSGEIPRRAVSSSIRSIVSGTSPYCARSSGGISIPLASPRLLSQIGVAIEPGSISATWTPELRSSTRSASPTASIACLDAA